MSARNRICALLTVGFLGTYVCAIEGYYLIGFVFSFVFGWNIESAWREMGNGR